VYDTRNGIVSGIIYTFCIAVFSSSRSMFSRRALLLYHFRSFHDNCFVNMH